MNELQSPTTVLLYPNELLRRPTELIPRDVIKTKWFQSFIDGMFDLMYTADGVGLAAPQVSQLLRMTVIDAQDGTGKMVLINPRITARSYRNDSMTEGCLSIPGVYGPVKRSRFVTIEYLDRDGQQQVLKAPHFLSRVIQHELDHLDGVLFTDKAQKITHGQDTLDLWNAGEQPMVTVAYPYTY